MWPMATPKKSAARPRRTQREILEESVVKSTTDIERLEDRLSAARAAQKDARKKLSAINAADRATAVEQIAVHEAELERLRALLSDTDAD